MNVCPEHPDMMQLLIDEIENCTNARDTANRIIDIIHRLDNEMIDKHKWDKDGVTCPTCHHKNVVNNYAFTWQHAKLAVLMDRAPAAMKDEFGFLHVENFLQDRGLRMTGIVGKLVDWELAEKRFNEDTKKNSSGMYKLTAAGINFVNGNLKIPARISVYRKRVLEVSSELISIRDTDSREFNYQDMINRRGIYA